ncbi:ABC transporter permease [Tissierella creatinophila]|uniref:Putative multiple-sugar transport system permease YteP n=1 Tax=Tissierella creatinophila DSM 6911 TaxID=1123403 RepID=A0A1U7M7A3_TISCR|nr:ABC transporter permease subunit [Tissierella creatinophila]OLS03177.1 putative multiple-sugar transport system permease YteP [Tissierella creatinophila DSM 6911]
MDIDSKSLKKPKEREVVKIKKESSIIRSIKNNWILYLMILPGILWYIIFCYAPMGGTILAFKSYRYDMGILKSPWVGLENFRNMFRDRAFIQAFKNTIIFSLGKLLFHFPVPIIVAILLNEIKNIRLKKIFQTIFTFPHFISWVVLASIFTNLFSSNGLINQVLINNGFKIFSPLITPDGFRGFIWISNIWKEFGWDSIIYMAAFTSIDPGLYEAAEIDGAGRLGKMIYITLPGIKHIIAIMLILEVGNIMGGASFNQIFNLYSPPVYGVADIIDTFVQRYTFEMGVNFGYTTAVGLFKSIIGVIMITLANRLIVKTGEQGLF